MFDQPATVIPLHPDPKLPILSENTTPDQVLFGGGGSPELNLDPGACGRNRTGSSKGSCSRKRALLVGCGSAPRVVAIFQQRQELLTMPDLISVSKEGNALRDTYNVFWREILNVNRKFVYKKKAAELRVGPNLCYMSVSLNMLLLIQEYWSLIGLRRASSPNFKVQF